MKWESNKNKTARHDPSFRGSIIMNSFHNLPLLIFSFPSQFGIPTEAELVTGFIVHISRHFRNKQGSIMEHVRLALKKRRAEFKELLYKQEEDEEEEKEEDEKGEEKEGEAGKDTEETGPQIDPLPNVFDSESAGKGEGGRERDGEREGEGVGSEYGESDLSTDRGWSENTSEKEGMLAETTDSIEGSERVHPFEQRDAYMGSDEPTEDEPTPAALDLGPEGEEGQEAEDRLVPDRDEEGKGGLKEGLEPTSQSPEAPMSLLYNDEKGNHIGGEEEGAGDGRDGRGSKGEIDLVTELDGGANLRECMEEHHILAFVKINLQKRTEVKIVTQRKEKPKEYSQVL